MLLLIQARPIKDGIEIYHFWWVFFISFRKWLVLKQHEYKMKRSKNMNFQKLATDIFKNVGGNENIISLVHCATRLRFTLKNVSKANEEKIKELPGVIGVINNYIQSTFGKELSKDEIVYLVLHINRVTERVKS